MPLNFILKVLLGSGLFMRHQRKLWENNYGQNLWRIVSIHTWDVTESILRYHPPQPIPSGPHRMWFKTSFFRQYQCHGPRPMLKNLLFLPVRPVSGGKICVRWTSVRFLEPINPRVVLQQVGILKFQFWPMFFAFRSFFPTYIKFICLTLKSKFHLAHIFMLQNINT